MNRNIENVVSLEKANSLYNVVIVFGNIIKNSKDECNYGNFECIWFVCWLIESEM